MNTPEEGSGEKRVVIAGFSDTYDREHDVVVDASPAALRALRSKDGTFREHKIIFPELYAHEYEGAGLWVLEPSGDIIDPPDKPQLLEAFLAEQGIKTELKPVQNAYMVEHCKHVPKPENSEKLLS